MNLNSTNIKFLLFTFAIFLIGLYGFEQRIKLRSLMNAELLSELYGRSQSP